MRGAPRDSHKLRLLKNPHRSKDELEAAQDAVVAPIVGDPPEWLDPLAKEEWGRVSLELVKKTWLGAIDETLFARYCQAYARWRGAEADITKRGSIVDHTDERNGMTWQKENPSVKIAMRWSSEMEKCARGFGITPSARRGWTEPRAQKTSLEAFRESLDDYV